jgi:hypothetical protein
MNEERESLLFMAPSFGAKVVETHETYESFSLKTHSAADKFCKFLDTKDYRRSGIVGRETGDWRVVIWFDWKKG